MSTTMAPATVAPTIPAAAMTAVVAAMAAAVAAVTAVVAMTAMPAGTGGTTTGSPEESGLAMMTRRVAVTQFTGTTIQE